MTARCCVRMTGPLVPHAGGFWAELVDEGYTRSQGEAHMRLMAHLSGWMLDQCLAPGDLGGDQVERFVEARCGAGYRTMVTSHSLSVVLGYLRRMGVVADEAEICPGTDLDVVLGDYRRYLSDDR